MRAKGQATEIGRINLYLPRELVIEYIMAQSPATKFDPSSTNTVKLAGGNRWKSRPEIYGYDLSFEQQDGQIREKYGYAPC